MTISGKAWELREKLFDLVREFKDLHFAAHSATGDRAVRAAEQADSVACLLAEVYDRMSGPSPDFDLFTDASRDGPDRQYDFLACGKPDAPKS